MEFLREEENKLVQAIKSTPKNWPAVRRICETEPHLINTNELGVTPLMRAAWRAAPEGVMLMLIEKATTETLECVTSRYGRTFLHYLVQDTYAAAAMRRAVERTSRHINKGDMWGRTPLHYCLDATSSYDEQREMALCLITFGVSLSIKDNGGKTPLDLYDDNKCSEYDIITRNTKKKLLRDLLEECSVPAEIIARGEDAVKAFKDEIQNGEITVVNSRIMFLGNEGAGKTSCVKAMLGKRFNTHEPSTDGIVTTTVFQTVGSKWEEQKDVDVCELAKQIREHAIVENVAKKLTESQQNTSKSASLSTSDPGRTSSSGSASSMGRLEEATSSMSSDERGKLHVSQVAGAVSTNQPIGSRANKLPDGIHMKLVDKLAEQSRGTSKVGPSHRTYSKKNKFKRFIAKMKGKKVVDNLANNSSGPIDITCIWDYAGQLTYYITHRFFLTDGSSYSVVFSLLDDLDAKAKPRDSQKGLFEMTNLQMNVFWIRSIYEHAVLHSGKKPQLINNKIASPPISLIGTHMDKLPGSDADKQQSIEAIFNRIFDEIKGTPYEMHVDREMYAVDNTAKLDKGIEKLKKNVGGYMKAMAKTVPTKWVDFQSKVQEVGKTRLRMSLDEITNIAAECGISKSKLITLLDYLNDIGIIMYSKTNEKLKNTVITNLRMMIDFLTKIITVVKPDDIDKWPTLMVSWHRLDNEGILGEELLRHLWRNEIATDASNFEVFLELMKLFGLLFEKQIGAQQGSRMFMVPSRMQLNQENLEVKKDEKQTLSIYVTPTDFLPDAIYNMLVVAFLDLLEVKDRSGDVKLFRNRSDFDLDDDHVVSLGAVKIENRHALKLEISNRIKVDEHGIEEALEPHPSICIEVLNYLRYQLKTVYVTMEGVGYELRVLCSTCEPIHQHHLHKLEDFLKKDRVPCGRKSMMTSRFKRLFTTGFDAKFTKETMNFMALQTLIVGRGTKELRRYFLEKTKLTEPEVKPFLTKERQHGVLKDVDFGDQTNVFSSADNIEAFNMSIMVTLLRYCCNNPNTQDFWENPPDDDKSELANLVRIYQYKKTLLDCSYSNRVTDEEFENRWKELTAMFTGVGVPVEDINNYRNPWQYKGGAAGDFCLTDIEEIRNFQAVLSVVVDIGTVTMRKYFLEVTKIDQRDVGNYLLNERKKGSFKNVNISKEQRPKMFTPTADIKTFDISIMYLIIRNCCSTVPVSFWNDPDRLPNLVHIHHYRNTKLAHTPNSRMSTKDFEIEWKKVRSMLNAAGASFNDIDKYKALKFTI